MRQTVGDVVGRVVKVLGANALGKGIRTVRQIVTIPLFLSAWGQQLYGEWLLMKTLPEYLSMSDLGFAAVTANEMTMKVAEGDRDGALVAFQSTWLFVVAVSSVVAIMVWGLVAVLPLRRWLNITDLGPAAFQTLVMILTIYVLVGLQQGFLSAGFRCAGRYHQSIMYTNAIQGGEVAAIATLLLFDAEPLLLAGSLLLVKSMGAALMWRALRRTVPWCRIGTGHARRDEVKRLAVPALSYMGFPIGNAVSNQGFLMLVGALVNPVAVVVFKVTRTLVNLVRQGITIINDAIWPELSAAFGAGRQSLLRRMHRSSCQIAFWLGVMAVVVLAVGGGPAIRLWTSQTVEPDYGLLYVLLAVGLLGSVWLTSSVVPVAANRHTRISMIYLAGTGASLALAVLLVSRIGLVGAGIALLLTELLMIVVVLRTSLRIAQDSLSDFVAGIMNIRLGFETVKRFLARVVPNS